MDGRHRVRGEPRGEYLSPAGRDLEIASEQGLRCRRAQTDHDLRLDQLDLLLQPGQARADLAGARLLVEPALALGNPLEMLDHIGDVGLAPVEACRLQRLIQDATGWPHEGPALEVLFMPRLLTDQDDARGPGAFSEDGLGGVLVQGTASTVAGGFPERAQRDLRRQELRCAEARLRHGFIVAEA